MKCNPWSNKRLSTDEKRRVRISQSPWRMELNKLEKLVGSRLVA